MLLLTISSELPGVAAAVQREHQQRPSSVASRLGTHAVTGTSSTSTFQYSYCTYYWGNSNTLGTIHSSLYRMYRY